MGIIKKFYKSKKKKIKQKFSNALLGEEHLKKAQSLEMKGEYKKAVKEYIKLEAYEKAGDLYELMGDQASKSEKKLSYYRKALEVHRDLIAMERIAQKLMATPGATRIEVNALGTSLMNQGAYEVAAVIFERLGEYGKAAKCYQEVGDLDRFEAMLDRQSEAELEAKFAAEMGEVKVQSPYLTPPDESSKKDKKDKKHKKDKKDKDKKDKKDKKHKKDKKKHKKDKKGSEDPEKRLKKLKKLYESGFIDEDEYEAKRSAILDEL